MGDILFGLYLIVVWLWIAYFSYDFWGKRVIAWTKRRRKGLNRMSVSRHYDPSGGPDGIPGFYWTLGDVRALAGLKLKDSTRVWKDTDGNLFVDWYGEPNVYLDEGEL